MRDLSLRIMRIAAPESDQDGVGVKPLEDTERDALSMIKENIEELKSLSGSTDIGDLVYTLDGNLQAVLDSVQELCSGLIDLIGSEDDEFATISSLLSNIDSIGELQSISTYLNPILRKSEVDNKSKPEEHALPEHEDLDFDPEGDDEDMPEDDEEDNEA